MPLQMFLRRLSISSRRYPSISPRLIACHASVSAVPSEGMLVPILSAEAQVASRRLVTSVSTASAGNLQSNLVEHAIPHFEKGEINHCRNSNNNWLNLESISKRRSKLENEELKHLFERRNVNNHLWKHELRSVYEKREVLIRSTFKRSNMNGLLKTRLSCAGALPFHKSLWSDVHVSGVRAVHSIVSDDDEEDESDDLDEFFMESDAKKSRDRKPAAVNSKNQKVKIHKSEREDEEEDGVTIITTKRKRSSAASFGHEPEDSDLSEDDKRKPMSSQEKARRSDDIRDASIRRKNIKSSIESLELGSDEEAENSSSECESRFSSSAEATEDSSVADDTDNGGPSYLTKTRFDKFDISPYSIKALHSVLKYERMTEVQEATFPVILKGQDVLAKARTGTGKTIAFLLPAIEAILTAPEGRSRNPINVLIVCPTRELAQQAANEAQVLLKFHRGLGAQVVYGGNSIRTEQMNLSRNPCQILVGTPGRLVDHIQRTPELARQLRSVRMFVLDEADHMLDMGFRDSLRKIMEAVPSQRQTLLFSATVPKEVHNISKIALRDDHVFIDAVGKNSQDTHIKVKQQYIIVPLEKQLRVLYVALKEHMSQDPQYKVLVFCTTARVTAFMCKLFSNLGFNSREIHSRKDQRYRTRVSDEFRQSKGGIILFTSDVSARGVDYPNVTLVVQVGAPSDFEQYIHRLGRTGRAGKKGEGLLILAPWEDYFLQKLESKKLPITLMPPPKLTSQAKIKILSTAGRIDFGIREPAYQAWIGYYKSLKGITLDKAKLVQYANQFSASMGFEEPPALSRMLISKLNLTGVPGIRVSR